MKNFSTEEHIEGQTKQKKRILILSDDTQLASNLSLFFGEEFHVQTVEQFDHACEIISRNHADLLLVDLGLPDKHIKNALCTIRRQIKIPIVLMYVFHEKKVSLESELRKNVDAVFYKPVNILDVLGQIRLFLS